MKRVNLPWLRWLALCLVLVAGCTDSEGDAPATAVPPTPTVAAEPTRAGAIDPTSDQNFIVVATDAPQEPFTSFNQFGEVTGLLADILEHIAVTAGLEFEFVVTPFVGALNNIGKDFDAVIAALAIPDNPPEGISYSDPYLQIGQVMLVLADERELEAYTDIQPGMTVGALAYSSGAVVATEILAVTEEDLRLFDELPLAVQQLIDEQLDALIMDHFSAEQFAAAYPEQLRIVGGSGPETWISLREYGIAVEADNTELLSRLNLAIAQIQEQALVATAVDTWIVPDVSGIVAGESRVGTSETELVIGMVGDLVDMDPGAVPDLIGWEVKQNTMSGLYRFTSENILVPALAAGPPAISEDQLVYTIDLKPGLRFPDGSDFTAADVKWSVDRAAVTGAGSFLINDYLKDSDEDNFVDGDAVTVISEFVVQFTLQEPVAYFPGLLAVPPYFPVSDGCYASVQDPTSTCGGIGPYLISSWTLGESMHLRANPDWPGTAPAFANIQLRFYEDTETMRRSLADFQSVDVAWSGLPYADYASLADQDLDGDGAADIIPWVGAATFKSYLVFEQSAPPWDNANVRQAAALAVDREALAAEVFAGQRQPLYSPVPDTFPGHTATLPARDLAQARALLLAAGYDPAQPLPVTIWYLNDGRYSDREEAYAQRIKAQLEETDVFQVTLQSAPWQVFQTQIFGCNYPTYLLGWPSPGTPVYYPDVTGWTNIFVENTDRGICSNYSSEAMTALLATLDSTVEPAARSALFAEMQALWAAELPTLDLTQESRYLLTLANVTGVNINAMGFLHYDLLVKEGN